jgi:aminoglycoside 3-N-acetyltransferase
MSKDSVDKDDIIRHLSTLGVRAGMNLVVHARLLSFGRINGGAESVYDALRLSVGPTATLVFPTYTLNLLSGDTFDVRKTPSYGMGALSEYARTRPDAYRTLCPTHSHATIGPLSDALMQCDPSLPIGPGSSFDAMLKSGLHLLLLGCNSQEGATFIHHVEAMVGVPYREWIPLKRDIRDATGKEQELTCIYYGRIKSLNIANQLDRAEQFFLAAPECRIQPINKRTSTLIPLAVLDRKVRELLNADPYALTVSKNEK